MHAPAIILVQPQLGENIGAAARAMSNFGLTDLRLVAPRDGWPNQKAWEVAAGGREILDRVSLFDTTEAALEGCHLAYGTTARNRYMSKPVEACADAVKTIKNEHAVGRQCAILFGPERTGLTNDDIALCNAMITIPTATENPSLNLAQAVVVLGYAWQMEAGDTEIAPGLALSPPATREELQGFLDHLESALEAVQFFKSPGHKPVMIRNLRGYFVRSQPTSQEISTLRGILRALAEGRKS